MYREIFRSVPGDRNEVTVGSFQPVRTLGDIMQGTTSSLVRLYGNPPVLLYFKDL